MEFTVYFMTGLFTPVSWVPAIAVASLLHRRVWPVRLAIAGGISLLVGLGFAVFTTPADPGTWLTLLFTLAASAGWSAIASLVIWTAISDGER